jgi:hypothetical protein
MVGYPRNSDLRIPDHLVLHGRTPLAFCRLPVRDNPVRSLVASRRSTPLSVQTDPGKAKHEEEYLASGYRSWLHRLPVLLKSPDG